MFLQHCNVFSKEIFKLLFGQHCVNYFKNRPFIFFVSICKINNNSIQFLAQNEYTELGQLKTKLVGSNAGSNNALQKVDYPRWREQKLK